MRSSKVRIQETKTKDLFIVEVVLNHLVFGKRVSGLSAAMNVASETCGELGLAQYEFDGKRFMSAV